MSTAAWSLRLSKSALWSNPGNSWMSTVTPATWSTPPFSRETVCHPRAPWSDARPVRPSPDTAEGEDRRRSPLGLGFEVSIEVSSMNTPAVSMEQAMSGPVCGRERASLQSG